MDTKQPEGFEAWAVVELMGHRRLAGFVTEQEVFGAGLLRTRSYRAYTTDCMEQAKESALTLGFTTGIAMPLVSV